MRAYGTLVVYLVMVYKLSEAFLEHKIYKKKLSRGEICEANFISAKTEKNNITGVLLWDLSAAFDTLDCDIFCSKLKIHGYDVKSVLWFRSYLTNRSQKVKIGRPS